jgi:copper(I)-binding protein
MVWGSGFKRPFVRAGNWSAAENTIRQLLMKKLLRLGLIMALCAVSVAKASPFMVHDVFARATVPGQSDGAAYLTIMNHGDQPDRLLEASSNAAQAVELHSTHTLNGVAHMQRETTLEIPVHGRLAFQPGGYHLMLVGLKAPLKAGDTIKLGLRFERAGLVEIKIPVKALGAGGEEEHHHHSGDGGGMSY